MAISNALETNKQKTTENSSREWLLGSYDTRNRGTSNSLFLDSSGNNNHATMSGVTNSSWLADGALKFNGINSLITTPISQNIFNNPNGGTVEIILDFGSREDLRGVAGDGNKGDFSLLFMQCYGNVVESGFVSRPRIIITQSSALVNGYAHYSFTYDRNMSRFYTDAVLKGSRSDNNLTILNNPILIGAGALTNPNCFSNGKMKLFNIYNKALTQQEITNNYNHFVNEKLL